MRKRITGLAMAALLCASASASASASAQQRANSFDPRQLKGPAKGVPNDVLVLGTAHLAQLPATVDPASLQLLHQRLLAWKPKIIAIEKLSGTQCAYLRQYPQRYKDTVEQYCWDPAPARATTGLDVPTATAEIERLLAHWPTAPSPSRRRQLAALLLAGGEPISALVQWLRLSAPERRAGDGLDGILVALLETLRVKRNETTLIAAPLAAALGLERVISMDDHSADTADPSEALRKASGEAIMKAWDNPATQQRKQQDLNLRAGLSDGHGVMALYRALNAPSQARLVHASDFGAALDEGSAQQFGRGYVGYWETRNLRMASNIREAVAAAPGNRTLVIVGASHKWYLEAYLDQMHDVRIISSDQVLR